MFHLSFGIYVLRCYWWLAGGAGVGVWFSFFAVPGYDGIGILEMALFDGSWTYFMGRGRILSNSSRAREGF